MSTFFQKKLLLSSALVLSALPLSVSAQTDTIPVMKYKTTAPETFVNPVMSDSVNLYGMRFDPLSLLKETPVLSFASPRLSDLVVTDGWVSFGEDAKSLRTLQVSLLTTKFEEVTLLVESDAPFRITLDGREIGESQEGTQSGNYTLKLIPSANRTLAVTTLTEKGDRLRLRLVPKLGGKTTLQVRTDDKEYMSLDFDLSGEALSGVQVSPSGRYFTVLSRYIKDLETSVTRLLYKDGKRAGTLAGDLYAAAWMPKSDLLYITKELAGGRRSLITIDPATMERTTLVESLPEGDFVFTADERGLIFFPQVKGLNRTEYVERVLGRYDHRDTKGNRDVTLLSHYDIATGMLRPLTYGYRGTYLVALSPDGKELIYSVPRDIKTSPFEASDYIALDLRTLKTDTLFTGEYNVSRLEYTARPGVLLATGSPDAFGGIGRDLPDGVLANTSDVQLYLYDRKAKKAKALTKDFDPSVGSVLASAETFSALFSAEDRDYKSLFRIDLSTGVITPVKTSEEYISSFGASNDLRTVVYEGESANNSDRLYAITGTKERVLYDLASKRLSDVTLGEVKDRTFTMPNGDKVPGRYYLPADFDPAKKYPLLVYYYGGTSPSGRMFDWYYSAPMYAGQGYVFLTLNPSGTPGWGQAYSARHVNAWGKITAEEIIESVKGFSEEMPFVDADHIGCFGASYGGFMTQYLLTRTNLFAAAISHAGISNIASYWGQGTWGIGYSTLASTGSYPWNNPALYAEQSPIFHADKINTPLLLTHGDSDTNVPYGESVQMYNALKILGKEVELLRVFGQDHHILELHCRQEWMETMMAWFQRYLKDDPSWWNDLYPEIRY
ncbi:MAG: prolyl oligopeptidase family serine peptidase [Porphyromonas sp.]|nr:prolyl oligopeptidase family serine peptidase [Bacteroidales bacterium]MDY3100159.1 prolyl oligopeptidase family serine peptidase [Porphyromonas sp.]